MTVRQIDDTLLAQLRCRVERSAERWRPGTAVREFSTLKGGTSSLTFVAQLDAGGEQVPVVVKAAPPGLEPTRNRDVLRQARLQQALQGGARSLAPAVLFTDAGDPPDDPPLMAMERVEGECVEPTLTEVPVPRDFVQARYADAVQVLATLHSAVPAEIGLGDEPTIDLAEEVDRWTRAFATLPAEMQGDYERAAELLLASVPEPLPPVVNHGDFRLGNTLCEGGRINAVIDWEIWSIGDPRIDLAWMAYFVDDAGHPAIAPGWVAGTPGRAELITSYEAIVGHSMPELDWFHALTRYKEAGITGLLLKRAMKLNRPLIPSMQRMLPALPRLVQESISIVG